MVWCSLEAEASTAYGFELRAVEGVGAVRFRLLSGERFIETLALTTRIVAQ